MHQNKNSKKTLKINNGFICSNCGFSVLPAEKTCRNHCPKCLCSLHVDLNLPGDRKNSCEGLMIPIFVDYKGKKGLMIIHQCKKCQKKIPNKTCFDDDIEKITEIMKKQNLTNSSGK